MFNILNFKPYSQLGIDINDTSINVVEMSYRNNQYCIEKSGTVKNCCSLQDNLNYKNFEENFYNTSVLKLKKLFIQKKFSSSKAVIALPCEKVIFHLVQLTNEDYLNNQDKLEEIILQKSYDVLPKPLYSLNYDFIKLDPLNDEQFYYSLNCLDLSIDDNAGNDNKINILLIAVQSDYLNRQLQIFEALDLDVVVVEVEAFALFRAKKYLMSKAITQLNNVVLCDNFLTACGLAMRDLC